MRPSRTLDAYLTRRALRTWPRAQVWRSERPTWITEPGLSPGQPAPQRTYTLRRRLHDWVPLGVTLSAARLRLDALAAETQSEVTP